MTSASRQVHPLHRGLDGHREGAGLGLTATPLESGARIAALDAIRGVALLGILLANVRQMFLPWDIAAFAVPGRNGSDLLAWLDWGFFDSLVDLKFITLFSLLFGAGFALQGERLAGRGIEFAGIYMRRLAIARPVRSRPRAAVLPG